MKTRQIFIAAAIVITMIGFSGCKPDNYLKGKTFFGDVRTDKTYTGKEVTSVPLLSFDEDSVTLRYYFIGYSEFGKPINVSHYEVVSDKSFKIGDRLIQFDTKDSSFFYVNSKYSVNPH